MLVQMLGQPQISHLFLLDVEHFAFICSISTWLDNSYELEVYPQVSSLEVEEQWIGTTI